MARFYTLPNGLEVSYQSKAELAQFYDDIFVKRVYTRHGITLKGDAWVFDVGANIGLFTVFAAHHFPEARIFSFEPAPPLFAALTANAAPFGNRVKLFNCGLSRQAGSAVLTFYPHSSGMSSFYPDAREEKAALRTLIRNELAQGKEGVEDLLRYEDELVEQRFQSETWTCPLRTLSGVIREQGITRIDLLKVDVEKSEMDVLAGLAEEDWGKVEQAVLEVHDLGDRLQEVSALFRSHGFTVTLEQEELYRGSDRWNVYAVRPRAALEEEAPEGIAVIGLAGRFPGAADTAELWRNLRDGIEAITRWSREDLAAAGVDPALLDHPQYVRAAGLLPGIELFDAPFFGFSPREAELMDPQQRLFLEQAWTALENAGYDTESYSGSIGIFGGMGMSNYLLNNLLSHPDLLAAAGPLQVRIFNDKDFLVSLAAFKMNLTGPSVNVQTACSTSLVATCLACQSLLAYQCDVALAGGVTLAVPQTAGYMAFESVMSPSGVCRAFDADADGTVGGSGAGLVVLKRLADALADGDTVHAVIKGFATNNDGSFKMGYTAPGVDGQVEVIAMAQAVAGIKGDSIGYVETHGTGTPLGDPVEVEALTEVFRAATEQTNSCALGSIKTNIGHLDTAAGIASLIKTVLALENRILPPSLNFERPNPQIDFAGSPFYVNTEARPWIANGALRRAGVSSFAIGGVNAHVVLEEAPETEPGDPAPPFVLLPLSARSETGLERRTDDLVRHLREHPEMTAEDFADAAFTLQVGRRAFRHRRAVVCRDRADALACLEGRDPRRLLEGIGETREEPLDVLDGALPDLGDPAALERGLGRLGRLWVAGVRLDWPALWRGRRRRVPLPTYPFERRRYWIEPVHRGASALEPPRAPEGASAPAPPLPARAPGVVHARPEIGVAYAEPSNETERTIAWMWCEMLGLDRVGIYDSFFDLGGDSLLATRLVSRLNETFGIGLTLSAIFEAPAVADLALVVAAARGGGEASAQTITRGIPKRTWDGPRPLSFAQRRLWFLDQLEPGNPFYNTPAASELHGPVDPNLLARAFTEIVRRHETLRASFGSVDGEPFLTVAEPGPWTLPLVDLSALPAAPARAEMMCLARIEAQTPFDLASGPLLRTALVRLDPRDHALFVTMHHIISDGWSNNVFLREMVALYEAYSEGRPSPLPELPIQYADFAAWQIEQLAEGILADQLAYWRQRLAGLPPALDLPADRPRPAVQTFRGARLATVIPDTLTARLRHLGNEEGGTLFMALFSALATFLYRHTGQEDFAIGVPVANRTRRETEGLIGFFTNTLVVRTAPAGRATFRELLRAVRTVAQEAFLHQDLPFEKLVEELQPQRDLSRSPFFQVMLVSTALDQSTVEGFAWQRLDVDPEVARFDLLFDLSEMGDRLSGVLEYSTDLFDASTAQRFESRLRTLLEEAAADPDRALSDLPLFSGEERAQILQEWSTQPPSPGAGRLVPQRVTEQAARTPDAAALIGFDGEELTYRELEERSNRLARRLRRLGVGPDVRVALDLERSPELLVALLAILKAGGAYVPLDPGYPEEWRAVMLEDSGALVVDWQGLDLSVESAKPLAEPVDLDLDSTAYVLYTSGSTGRPKGVAMVHRALANLVDWQIETMPGAWRTLQLTSLNFDVSFQEIFAAWAAGGSLVLIGEDDRRDPAVILALLRERQVERIFLPFVALQQLAEAASVEERLPERLREVVTAGEQLRVTRALADLFRRLPGARLHNQYGPTEAHVVTAHTLEGDPAAWPPLPPIGRPLSGVHVHVLDRDGGAAPLGVAGELMLGGICLARGYLGRPGLTAERFVPDPFAGLRGQPGARLYRTGDRARWRPDGTLELFGRLDDQMKIRGYRVEPGEIEAALSAHPAVAAAAVGVVQHGERGDRRLVAWVVAKEDKPSDLRAYCAGRLPEHEVPSAVVFLDAMPLTPSGKVDRRRLASLAADLGPETAGWTAPRNATEELLAGIWAEILGLPRVGVHDNFFALGGHSLLATRVASRVRAGLGVALPVRALFEAPTVAALAARLDAQRHSEAVAALPPIVPVPRTGPLPLSWSQERIWFLERLQPGQPAYNLPFAVDLRGALHTGALAGTLSEVVRRHEALRTAFREIDGKPVQEILPASPLDLPMIDLEALPEGAREAEAERLAWRWVRRPFDLRQGLLLAPALLRLALDPTDPTDRSDRSDHHRLLLSMHHIASDGWSIGILVREISALYPRLAGLPGGAPLPELPVQYADFAVWQRGWLHGEALDRLVAAWRARLDGAPPALDLPTDRPRPPQQTFEGANALFAFEAEPTAALSALAQAEGATLFMVLLAAWQSLLQRLSGQDDLVVGTPVAGRNRPETEDLIGVFINTLALRGDLSGDSPFRELVRRSRDTALEAYALQDLPFEKLVEELHPVRDLSRPPIFQVMLVLQNTPLGPLALPGLTLEPLGVDSGTAKFDLLLALEEREAGLTGALEHNIALFDGTTAERLLRCFGVLLRAAAADPGRRLSSLPLLTEAEIEQLVQDWNRTAVDFDAPGVPEQIAEQVRRDPHAVAVVFEGENLTRGELDARAESLAGHLRALGAGPETLVAIAIERSLELMVALLAVWKAGAAYLPIDPDDPRSQGVLAAAQPVAVLTREQVLACPPSPGDREEGAGRGAGGEGLAYVIYTSGSTGTPKGAMAHHRGLRNRLLWGQEVFGLRPDDTVLQKTPITFDVSVWELFWPLVTGARLVLAKPGGHRDPQYLIDLISRERVTVTHFVPSMLRAFLDDPALETEDCRSLRLVIASGEALTPDLVRRFYSRISGAELYNLYGPTETSIEVTAWACQPADSDGPVPIGYPIANTRIQILDPEGQPVPVGVPGELRIGGVPVGRGYLGRPDLTAERFVPDPFPALGETGARLYRSGDLARRRPDGAVEYLGRIDQQVKVRGVRIELGEIEAALGSHPAVREAAVIVRQDAAGPNLIACVVPAAGREVDSAELRSFLRQTLPEPMIPTAFAVLPNLPLTRSGKVDRRRLAALSAEAREGEAASGAVPRTRTEELLARIWGEILGLSRVGVHESFFALGGHSLLATRVTSRVRAAFGVTLPVRALFEAPTLAGLAAWIDAARSLRTAEAPPILSITASTGVAEAPLSFAQERLWFLDQLAPGNASYNMPTVLRLTGDLDIGALRRGFTEIARRHATLRTVFARPDGTPRQVVAPAAPVPLPVLDLSALPAPRREEEAARLVAAEVGRPFDLEHGPVLRLHLLRNGRNDHTLISVVHHIASDGWSMGILVRESAALYQAFAQGDPSPLPELPVQYVDYALWQRSWLTGPVLQEQLDFWRNALAGAPALLELPTDRPRPAVPSTRGATIGFVLPAGAVEAVQTLSRQAEATPFMVLLAAFQTLLHRWSGMDDVLVGSPVANRGRVEIEGLIGMFINTLVFRLSVREGESFLAALGRVRTATLAGHDHQDLPFERLVDALEVERSLAHTPIFQTMLVLQNAPAGALEVPGLTFTPVSWASTTSKFDLTLSVVETPEGIAGSLEYATDLFDRTTVERFLGHFGNLLASAGADPGLPLADLCLLDAAEEHLLVADLNRATRTWARLATVHALIAEQARRIPDQTAAAGPAGALTYRELDAQADALALRIQAALGETLDQRIALLADPDPQVLVGMLGILKSGAGFVPIDPRYPDDRIAWMLADSACGVLVTQKQHLARAQALTAGPILCLEEEEIGPIRRIRPIGPIPSSLARSLSYIVYTSGSTGRPKGVQISHENLVPMLLWGCDYFDLGEHTRVLQSLSISFDFGIFEHLTTVLAGGTLFFPGQSAGEPAAFGREIARLRINTLHTTPAFARELAAVSENRGDLDSLEIVHLGGEALLRTTVARIREAAPHATVYNGYGPTESTVNSSIYRIGDETSAGPVVPIGQRSADNALYLLDRAGRLVPLGVRGELHIGGIGVARGYLNRPDLTAERFLPDPFGTEPGACLYRSGDLARCRPDGVIEFLGRIDQQVKVRGFRIELGEIEAALGSHPAVREAAVVLRQDATGPNLVACIVPAAGRESELGELRSFLRKTLPEPMIPAAFVTLPSLPLTRSGKVDRRALAQAGAEAAIVRAAKPYVAPQTPLEEWLVTQCSDLLRLDRVGINDNFFDLGGHSLLATQLLARLQRDWAVELPLRDLFAAPDLAALAESITERELAAAAESGELDDALAELGELSAEELNALLSGEA
jgi:amino acid adenylation domain-containing protein/FkbM family methyltransferase